MCVVLQKEQGYTAFCFETVGQFGLKLPSGCEHAVSSYSAYLTSRTRTRALGGSCKRAPGSTKHVTTTGVSTRHGIASA
eukprot:3847313-Rhodomonas_salina.5